MQDEINSFTQMVHAAFGDTSYPENNLVQSGTNPNYVGEEISIIKHFTGKRWQEITLESLIANRDCISWFTVEAYRYYLPAYMIAVITHFHEVDVLSNNTLYHLTPPDEHETWKTEFITTSKGFTQAQKSVIQNFIALYARLSPETLAYDPGRHLQRAAEFWSQLSDK